MPHKRPRYPPALSKTLPSPIVQKAKGRAYVYRRNALQYKLAQYQRRYPTSFALQRFTMAHCINPSGHLVGQPMRILPWQLRFTEQVLDNPDIRTAYLTLSRKQGKTSLLSCYIALALGASEDEFERNPFYRIGIIATAGHIAKETMTLCRQMTLHDEEVASRLKFSDFPFPGNISGPRDRKANFFGTTRKAGLGAAHDLVVADEIGMWDQKHRSQFSLMQSSMVAREDSKMICIGTKYEGILLKEGKAQAGHPNVYYKEYSAKNEDLDFRNDKEVLQGLREACPSLGVTITYKRMRQEYEKAKQSKAAATSFAADYLNMPHYHEVRELLCTLEELQGILCDQDDLPPKEGRPFLALDIGSSASMTACCAVYPNGRMEVMGAFPMDEMDLAEREKRDYLPEGTYESMHKEGTLLCLPGAVTPVDLFLEEVLKRHPNPIKVGSDRWRHREVLGYLKKNKLKLPMVWRGTGAHQKAEGSMDLINTQKAIISKSLKMVPNVMFSQALAESIIRYTPTGSPALDKRAKQSRIDCLQAAIIAVSLWWIANENPTKKPGLKVVVRNPT